VKRVGYYVRSPLIEVLLWAIVIELVAVVFLLGILVSKA